MVKKIFLNMYYTGLDDLNPGDTIAVQDKNKWYIFKIIHQIPQTYTVKLAVAYGFLKEEDVLDNLNYTYYSDNPPSIENDYPLPGATWFNYKESELFTLQNYRINNKPVWIGNKGTIVADTLTTIFDIFNDNSCIALYEFNNSTSDTGGKYDGVPHLQPKYTTGIFGTGFVNFRNQYVEVPKLINIPTGNCSISVWVRPYSANHSYGSIVHFSKDGNNLFSLWYHHRQRYFFAILNDHNYNLTLKNESQPNIWYHLVITSDGTIYINDEQVLDSQNKVDLTKSNLPFLIGADRDSKTSINDWFDGVIDNVRVFDRVLNKDEVGILYQEYKHITQKQIIPEVPQAITPVYSLPNKISVPNDVIDTKLALNFKHQDSFTIIGKVKITGDPRGYFPIAGKISYQWSLMVAQKRLCFVYWTDSGSESIHVKTQSVIQKNKWYKFAFIYDGSKREKYFILQGKKDSWIIHDSGNEFRELAETARIGECYIWNRSKTPGIIEHLEIYNERLSDNYIISRLEGF